MPARGDWFDPVSKFLAPGDNEACPHTLPIPTPTKKAAPKKPATRKPATA